MKNFIPSLLLVLSLFSPLTGRESLKIIIMLTNPRSISSAFEKTMISRGDHTVIDEPWVASHMLYNGDEKLFQQLPPEDIVNAKNYQEVKRLIYRYAEKKPVFVKDMIWPIANEILSDDTFLSDPQVTLAILIRNPAQSLESCYEKGSELISAKETLEFLGEIYRYDALYNLAEKYHRLRGQWPIIVEAEEVCKKPEAALKTFCQKANISYMPEMLTWQEGMPEQWKHLANWHLDAAKSSHFFVPSRAEEQTRFSKVPESHRPIMEEVYQHQNTFYEALVRLSR